MSWRKNAISYISWLVYTLIVGAALLCLADVVCDSLGLVVYWAAILALLYVVVVGGIVFGINQLYRKLTESFETKVILSAVLEITFVVILIVVGFFLRIQHLDAATDPFGYFEKAQLTYGGSLSQVAHGAEYLYLLVLRGLFTAVGNHVVAGVWMQVVLQLLGALVFFLAVRRLAGAVAALITLGFCMCGPYMITCGLSLSPEMLFFLLFALVFLLIGQETGDRLRPISLLPMGLCSAICTYLDVAGILLLFFALCMIFAYRKEKVNINSRVVAICSCVVGFLAGFFGCIWGDALSSGKEFGDVLAAWGDLYSPTAFEIPFVLGTGEAAWESYLLVGLMVFGIYSFWCDREKESLSIGTIALCVIIGFVCFGIFTPQMPGYFYLYLMMAMLAGVGVGGCVKYSARRAATVDSVMEYLESKEIAESMEVPEIQKADVQTTEVQVEEQITEEQTTKEQIPEVQTEEEQTPEEITQIQFEEAQGVAETVEESPVLPKEEEIKPKVKFLDNPLPLPKKHEKKVLDYAIGLTRETAEFDYEVSETDDFDI